jgi:hypothetical protein
MHWQSHTTWSAEEWTLYNSLLSILNSSYRRNLFCWLISWLLDVETYFVNQYTISFSCIKTESSTKISTSDDQYEVSILCAVGGSLLHLLRRPKKGNITCFFYILILFKNVSSNQSHLTVRFGPLWFHWLKDVFSSLWGNNLSVHSRGAQFEFRPGLSWLECCSKVA